MQLLKPTPTPLNAKATGDRAHRSRSPASWRRPRYPPPAPGKLLSAPGKLCGLPKRTSYRRTVGFPTLKLQLGVSPSLRPSVHRLAYQPLQSPFQPCDMAPSGPPFCLVHHTSTPLARSRSRGGPGGPGTRTFWWGACRVDGGRAQKTPTSFLRRRQRLSPTPAVSEKSRRKTTSPHTWPAEDATCRMQRSGHFVSIGRFAQ